AVERAVERVVQQPKEWQTEQPGCNILLSVVSGGLLCRRLSDSKVILKLWTHFLSKSHMSIIEGGTRLQLDTFKVVLEEWLHSDCESETSRVLMNLEVTRCPLLFFAGPRGLPGIKGSQGSKGEKGDPGQMITDGKTPGEPGKPGFPGYTGLKGEPGTPGPSGLSGSPGFPGVQGSQGQRGETGSMGDAGLRGEEVVFQTLFFFSKKNRSDVSCRDEHVVSSMLVRLFCPGSGEKGDRGPPGLLGRTGYSGQTGLSGNPGASGITGPEVRTNMDTRGVSFFYHLAPQSAPCLKECMCLGLEARIPACFPAYSALASSNCLDTLEPGNQSRGGLVFLETTQSQHPWRPGGTHP
uniref:Uncharacterized protein n=1 Tax=Oryzias sinensis TaxID=183150 RepID=A0A8C7X5E3_9TELE